MYNVKNVQYLTTFPYTETLVENMMQRSIFDEHQGVFKCRQTLPLDNRETHNTSLQYAYYIRFPNADMVTSSFV